ncbi:MAG: radical SAM protein [Symploca sp. SIO2D2]|nr:radical SAM protein [Symploca sp. SIO2D2]
MGRSAFFIRLFGCPVKCSWCDSAGTWHSDYVPAELPRMEAGELAGIAKASGAEFVVVTGGEPAIHDLNELSMALKKVGLPVHLETSGGFPIRGEFDWVTLSPKWQKLPVEPALQQASEFKLIVENAKSIDKWIQALDGYLDRPTWLHPEWSVAKDPAILESITEAVKRRGWPFRAGFQLHKLYRADSLDENSREAAPLGGKPELGY